jgi:hypothetical protein
MKNRIGENAGLVWKTISASGKTMGYKALKKTLKLTDKDLFAALGWLAREDKVYFDESVEDTIIGLA